MRAVATALDGFIYYSTCTCGGALQDKYKRVGNETNKYYIFPRKGQVRLYKNGRNVGMFPLSQLEQKLTEYDI